jgi:hypothetical protein
VAAVARELVKQMYRFLLRIYALAPGPRNRKWSLKLAPEAPIELCWGLESTQKDHSTIFAASDGGRSIDCALCAGARRLCCCQCGSSTV